MDDENETHIGQRNAARAIARFLRDYFADQDAGRERPLAAYLADAVGFETEVERAYRQVQDENDTLQLELGGLESTLEPGLRLGSYRIEEEIGAGGQGVVYAAIDSTLDRRVAIKVLRTALQNSTFGRRFEREARVLARLDHPGICGILEVHLEERPPYLVLPWIEGRSLARLIRVEGATLDRAEALRRLGLIEQAARALHAAHEVGIVHRDLKPGNIMEHRDGRVVVLDFGLAMTSEGTEAPTLTNEGQILGTLPYMSPEQLAGRPLDRRTDVYSLAVTAHELITGALPHEGVEMGTRLEAIALGDRRPLGRSIQTMFPDLQVALDVAMDVDAAGRYTSLADFADDLRRIRDDEPIKARRLGPLQRLNRWRRRHRALAAATAASFLLLAAGLVTALVLLDRVNDQRRLATNRLAASQRLADLGLLDDLADREAVLWPVSRAIVDDLLLWLADRNAILERLERHAADLARLRSEVEPSAEDRRMTRILDEIVRRSDRLREQGGEPVHPAIEVRLEKSRAVAQATLIDARPAWRAAARRVADDARYAGLALEPREGLVPLGRDPQSQLEEFALWVSGTVPAREPGSGRLVQSADSAVVLVLLPGAIARLGATRVARSPNDSHIDPRARDLESPVHTVELDAFLIAKYELTQSQFMSVNVNNPSENYYVTDDAAERSRHPVDSIDWARSRETAQRLGGDLPTEAQWEHACRAGTTTVFSCGNEPLDLEGSANLADQDSKNAYHDRWVFEEDFEDGFIGHAPVGHFAANPFGLHDMHGNVWEWCLDHYCDYGVPVQVGSGLRPDGDTRYRMLRGGSYFFDSYMARSAHRELVTPTEGRFHIGMRLVINLHPR
ncbi:MAG: SUMF1/EgtB/PvdO family nonheme iron enzyme [Planctomycetes bacterium]|nr:SUMF1/EgtB/PvdO family nonheme iron enzyme [Planctomycetota bacterium]